MERDKSKDDDHIATPQIAPSKARGRPGKSSRSHSRYAGVPAPPVQLRVVRGPVFPPPKPLPNYPDMFGGVLDMPVQLAPSSHEEPKAPVSNTRNDSEEKKVSVKRDKQSDAEVTASQTRHAGRAPGAGASTSRRRYNAVPAPIQRQSTNAKVAKPANLMSRADDRDLLNFATLPHLNQQQVQRNTDGAAPLAGERVQQIAAHGVQGAGRVLPHVERIQEAFGSGHDLSQVKAHVGGRAAVASKAIGAVAYATGNSVAFDQAPDLHTAAHEAAHVVQQRAGVQLKGGVGQVGDEYERNADAVADRVLAGKSAADLLPAGGGGGSTPNNANRAGVMKKPEPGLEPPQKPKKKPLAVGYGAARGWKLNLKLMGVEFSGAIKVTRKTNAGATSVGVDGPGAIKGPRPSLTTEAARTTELDGKTGNAIKTKISSGIGGSLAKGMGQISSAGFYLGFQVSYAGPELEAKFRGKGSLSVAVSSLKFKGVGRYQPPGSSNQLDFSVELKAKVSEKTIARWVAKGMVKYAGTKRAASKRLARRVASRAEVYRLAGAVYDVALKGAKENVKHAKDELRRAALRARVLKGSGAEKAAKAGLTKARAQMRKAAQGLRSVKKYRNAMKKSFVKELTISMKGPPRPISPRYLIERGIKRVLSSGLALTIGRVLGRAIPIVNIALLIWDLYEVMVIAKQLVDDGAFNGIALKWPWDAPGGNAGKGAKQTAGKGHNGASWNRGSRGGKDIFKADEGGATRKSKQKGPVRSGVKTRVKPVGKKRHRRANRAIQKVSFPKKGDLWITFEDSKAGKKARDYYAQRGTVVEIMRKGKKQYYGSPAVAGLAVIYQIVPDYKKARGKRVTPGAALPPGITKIQYLNRGQLLVATLDPDHEVAIATWSDPDALYSGRWRGRRRVYGDPRYNEAKATVTLARLRRPIDLDRSSPKRTNKKGHKPAPKPRGRKQHIPFFDLDRNEDLERRVDYKQYSLQQRFLGRTYRVRMGGKVLYTAKLQDASAHTIKHAVYTHTLTLVFNVIGSARKGKYRKGSQTTPMIRIRRVAPTVELASSKLVLAQNKLASNGTFPSKSTSYTLSSRRTGRPAVKAKPVSYKEQPKQNRWTMKMKITSLVNGGKVLAQPAWHLGQIVGVSGELHPTLPLFPKGLGTFLRDKETVVFGAYYAGKYHKNAKVEITLKQKLPSGDPTLLKLRVQVGTMSPGGGKLRVYDAASSSWRWVGAGGSFVASVPAEKKR